MYRFILLLVIALLTQFTIQAQIPSYVPTNGLVGWWGFNGNANDVSGNGRNGIVYGATLTSDRKLQDSSSYSFNGINDWIYLGDWFNYFSYSISIWIKPANQSGFVTVIDNNHTHNVNWVFHSLADNLYWGWSNKEIRLNPEEWHHLVFTYSDNFGTLYHNGSKIGEFDYYTLNYLRQPSLALGRSIEYGRNWKGVMDDLGIWNRVLTEYEVRQLYQDVNFTVSTEILSTVTCNSESNGIARVNVNGGLGPYTYKWNTDPIQTTQIASNLRAGTYTVIVTDQRDSIRTAEVIITEPQEIRNLNTFVTNGVDCLSPNGGIAGVTIPEGGTPPYVYEWNTMPIQTGRTAVNLSAGEYRVTVTDKNGCTKSATVTIAEAENTLSVGPAIIEQEVSCYGKKDGVISIPTPSSGLPPYTYIWNTQPVQYNQVVSEIGAGTYTAVIIDSRGCKVERTIVVDQPNKVEIYQPQDTLVGISETSTFFTESSNENSSYQWQTNLGTGFNNLEDIFQYSGSRTRMLTVSNCNMFNHNQPFRCIIETNGCFDTTAIAVLSVRINVGVDEEFDSETCRVYPNPTGDSEELLVQLENVHSQVLNIELLDMMGISRVQTGIQSQNRIFPIAVSGIAKGMYIVRVITSSGILTQKIIVN
jgi:Concanavalin A-like lectin/glucanases superfamily/Secretion system C-terminal sorting domain/SprB repeat